MNFQSDPDRFKTFEAMEELLSECSRQELAVLAAREWGDSRMGWTRDLLIKELAPRMVRNGEAFFRSHTDANDLAVDIFESVKAEVMINQDRAVSIPRHESEAIIASAGAVAVKTVHTAMSSYETELRGSLIEAKEKLKQISEEMNVEVLRKIAYETAVEAVEERRVFTRQVTLTLPDKSSVTVDRVHRQFDELAYWVELGHVYLWGPPGGGKTTIAKQMADARGVGFGAISLNLQTPRVDIMGFIDATGRYVRTAFRDCYEYGGLFLIDELDNGGDSLLTSLNSALDNGFCRFPDAMVAMHHDFRCIGTGNTGLRGGDMRHAGRRAQDAAAQDRFAFIMFAYDEELEHCIAQSIAPGETTYQWMRYVQKVRALATEFNVDVLASPRATYRGAHALTYSSLPVKDIAESALFKGAKEDARRVILERLPLTNFRAKPKVMTKLPIPAKRPRPGKVVAKGRRG